MLLICKQRPAFQKGLWNGVGGKIERGETPAEAMRREFAEEVAGFAEQPNWQQFAVMSDPDVVEGTTDTIHVFRAYGSRFHPIALTDEPLTWFHLRMDLHPDTPMLESTRFLIPMANQSSVSALISFAP